MAWFLERRYGALAVAFCLFALARLAFASGSGTCRLIHNVPAVQDMFGRWLESGPGTFRCKDISCGGGNCPSAPASSTYLGTDYDGDGNEDPYTTYVCSCATGDRPANSGNQYCRGLGKKIDYSGGQGTDTWIDCIKYGSCTSCVIEEEVEEVGWPESMIDKWCECP